MTRKIIALMTDYGYRDPYVGVVKAVIKSINPDAEIIDITHGVTRHNVLESAVMIAAVAPYFPKGTIFVVVVDPGVGGSRRAIIVETSNYVLIGPDNGCLSILARRDGVKRVFDVSNSKYRLPEVSSTFHGRDIFAPIAAWLSKGIPIEEMGEQINPDSITQIVIDEPIVDKENKTIKASIVYIDVYGNVMTNIEKHHVESLSPRIGSRITIKTKHGVYECIYETTFSRVPVGELVCYINSWGYLEIAVNQGDASKHMGLKQSDQVEFKLIEH